MPGLELPGLELPGLELPGLEPLGLEQPGLEQPGLEPLGLEPPGLEPQERLNTPRQADDSIDETVIEEFGFPCSVCGTRMIATTEQVGLSKTCPDCYTPHTVPPPARVTRRTQRRSRPAAEGSSPTHASADGGEDADEYRLAPAEEIGSAFGLNSATVERLAKEAQDQGPAGDALDRELADAHFGFRCSGCGSRLYASMADIGSRQVCPECGSTVPVPLPDANREAPRRASAAGETESSGLPVAQRKEGDEALERARAEVRRREEEGAGTLEEAPWPWIRSLLVDPAVLLRVLILSIGWLIVFTFLDGVVAYWNQGAWALLSMLMGVVALLVGVPVAIFMAVCCQVIVGDTANGNRRVANWPDGMFMEWWVDSLFVLTALFLSSLPGLALAGLARQFGAGDWLLIPLCLLSAWALFPPVLLSMLATGSPVLPFSLPIWQSLLKVPFRWLKFYATSGGLALLLMLFLLLLLPQWILLNALAAGALVLAAVSYSRLLGHLAWTCRDELAELEERSEGQDEDQDQQPAADPKPWDR